MQPRPVRNSPGEGCTGINDIVSLSQSCLRFARLVQHSSRISDIGKGESMATDFDQFVEDRQEQMIEEPRHIYSDKVVGWLGVSGIPRT